MWVKNRILEGSDVCPVERFKNGAGFQELLMQPLRCSALSRREGGEMNKPHQIGKGWWESDMQWVTCRTMPPWRPVGCWQASRGDSRDVNWLTQLSLMRRIVSVVIEVGVHALRGRTSFAFTITPSTFKMTRRACIQFVSMTIHEQMCPCDNRSPETYSQSRRTLKFAVVNGRIPFLSHIWI